MGKWKAALRLLIKDSPIQILVALSFVMLLLTGAALQDGGTVITWKTLADVKYRKELNGEYDLYFMYPAFGPKVRSLDGKRISIKGYMIPVDEYGRSYVISAKPMAQCFFCGGAGPESLIELQLKKKGLRFKTDEIRTVTGVLRLNARDVDHLNYILKEVEVFD